MKGLIKGCPKAGILLSFGVIKNLKPPRTVKILKPPRDLRILGVLGILSLSVLSCVSGSGKGSWASYPEPPAHWNYELGNIQVTVDHVQEEGIAFQIGGMAETLMAAANKKKLENGIPLALDIRVEQRSFLHSVELFNTIYVDCLVRDGEGRVLGREYRYSVGKGSIISSKEQRRLLSRALKKILKAQQKRSRKTGRHQKKDA
jgi:hypothetical protein